MSEMTGDGIESTLGMIDRAEQPYRGISGGLRWMGDRINPILVKESRQSLKSKQFVITFFLVLASAWLWTILGVSNFTPEIFYSGLGIPMLIGYLWILSFPLLVIVPFGAFRSLAVEIEDGTFELIRITTLSPRQIVSGKLGSAVLQGLIYFSALAPCVVFTYLLRGIELLTIVLLLFHLAFLSFQLCLLGLFMATISQTRVWQLLISVTMVIVLFLIFAYLTAGASSLLNEIDRVPIEYEPFWVVQIAVVTTMGSFGWLAYEAGASRLTFVSENRSTRLRVVMLFQQFLVLCWVTYAQARLTDSGILFILICITAVYWMVMGSLMIGESSQIAERALRSFPKTMLSRSFLQWLTPGPMSGYQFAVLNLAGFAIFITCLVEISPLPPNQPSMMPSRLVTQMAFLLLGYLVFYLGLAKLMTRSLAKWNALGPGFGFLVSALLVLFGCLVPTIVRMSFENTLANDYYLWEVSYPPAAVYVIGRHYMGPIQNDALVNWTYFIVAVAAGIVYVVATVTDIGALRRFRASIPERVAEDDRENRSANEVSSDLERPAPHPLDD